MKEGVVQVGGPERPGIHQPSTFSEKEGKCMPLFIYTTELSDYAGPDRSCVCGCCPVIGEVHRSSSSAGLERTHCIARGTVHGDGRFVIYFHVCLHTNTFYSSI